MNSSLSRKSGYYLLEGLNSFAASYFFAGFMFLLHKEHGRTDLDKLWIGAAHGFLYVGGSWFAGSFGQRRGYFTALTIGFGGMGGALLLGWASPSFVGQLVALAIWTLAMCFTWTSLEALVSEGEPPRILANRLGLYNVVWALTSSIGYFVCGWIFERLGPASLYWLPAALHGIQLILLPFLKKQHDSQVRNSANHTDSPELQASAETEPARPFLQLARLANPFSYMAINALLVIVPALSARIGLSRPEATMWLSIWHFARAATFGILWSWHGWHYRRSWLISAQVAVILGFIVVMAGNSVWHLALGQLIFGWGTGLTYYAALFYAMDGTKSHGDHSGIHEALVGMGIGGGPFVCALSLTVVPGVVHAPIWAMGGILVAALSGSILQASRLKR